MWIARQTSHMSVILSCISGRKKRNIFYSHRGKHDKWCWVWRTSALCVFLQRLKAAGAIKHNTLETPTELLMVQLQSWLCGRQSFNGEMWLKKKIFFWFIMSQIHNEREIWGFLSLHGMNASQWEVLLCNKNKCECVWWWWGDAGGSEAKQSHAQQTVKE